MPTALKDYEPIIRAQNPKISWTIEQNYHGADYSTLHGSLTVPSSYDRDDNNTSIQIFTQKYIRNSNATPTVHVILLAGGPGYDGETKKPSAAHILKEFAAFDVACYTIDHRGVGNSGKFVKAGIEFPAIQDQLGEIVSSGPFPIRDLTIHNAALDTGMLAVAIQSSPDWSSGARLVVMGSSYGSSLAHQTVRLLPNLFHSGVLELVPTMKGLSRPSMEGLAESCALDSFCRERIGANVWEETRKAIRRITQLDTNECIRAFAEQLTPKFQQTNYQGRVILLSMLFRPSLLGLRTGHFHPAELLIPFLKVTSDCSISPDTYLTKIFQPASKFFNQSILESKDEIMKQQPSQEQDIINGNGGMPLNTLANSVLLTDLDYYAGPPVIADDVDDIPASFGFISTYSKRYRHLLPHLSGFTFTDTRPLSTKRTKMFIGASRLDMNTTHQVAYGLFQSINAAEKIWFLMEHRGHENLYSPCYTTILMHAFGYTSKEGNSFTDQTACLKTVNEAEKLDWTFASQAELADIWKYVSAASQKISTTAQTNNIPIFERGSMATRPVSPIMPDKTPPPFVAQTSQLLRNPYFWLASILFGVIFILSIGTVIYFKILARQRTAPTSDENENY